MGYVKNVLIGLDQAANTILGGHPDETISARSGRARKARKVWGKIVADALDWIQPNHAVEAEAGDKNRAETVETIEEKDLDGN